MGPPSMNGGRILYPARPWIAPPGFNGAAVDERRKAMKRPSIAPLAPHGFNGAAVDERRKV